MSLDLVIVGAGAAGLTAARSARAQGLRYVVVEAKSRIGGRAHTDTATFGVPVDYGCHWLHAADINPFTRIADAYGVGYWRGASNRRLFETGRWLDQAQGRAFEDYCRRCWQAVADSAEDVAMADVIPFDRRWHRLFSGWCAAVNGLEPQECSTLDWQRFLETGNDWPVIDGYGALIARFGSAVDVCLNTAVRGVRWGRRGVTIVTDSGALAAKAVLLSVSTGVLAAESIRFEPLLPVWKREAIAAVPMGQANKIIVQCRPGALPVPADCHVRLDDSADETLGFHLRPFGRELAIAYVAGRFSQRLERQGRSAMIDFALARLKAMFGNAIEREIVKADATAWDSDPEIRGAYSLAKPGYAEQRKALGLPIADKLFFAGEATSQQAYGAAHGAYWSAQAALKGLSAAVRLKESAG